MSVSGTRGKRLIKKKYGDGGCVSHRDTEETEAAGQACLAQRKIHK